MSNRDYSNELRTDTVSIILPIVSTSVVLLSLVGLFTVADQPFRSLWHLIVILIASPLAARISRQWLRRGRLQAGAFLFLGTHLLLLTLLLAMMWQPGSPLPYVYVLFTIFASMLLWPSAGFYAWNVATLLTLLGAALSGSLTTGNALELLFPVLLNLLAAAAMYLTALEWETAVESVSLLHRRARDRRDELFAVQEALSQTNERLRFLNQQLDLARMQAEQERDIRTRFMNNVSHELRAPLNAIVNFAHILIAGGSGPVSEPQRDYLARIERSGWHLLGMLNDLLDMAQIESGEFKLYLADDDLQELCADAESSAQGLLLDNPRVIFETDFPAAWPRVRIDRTRIRQAVINLLSNAAKYTDTGRVTLRVRSDAAWVYLTVADTGVGIAPEHHELIFQEFRQVDETAARKRIGTGLGLPIARQLVERHGGHIQLESAVGQGSRFTICLPRLAEPPAQAAETAVQQTSLAPP